MKVLLINGSPRKDGNTQVALGEIAQTLQQEGVETETVWIGTKPVRGCCACGKCKELAGKAWPDGHKGCAFDDDVANAVIGKLKDAAGIVIGTPTYYGQPNGAFLAVWQRVCFAGAAHVKAKPAASIAVCRRGGSTAAFQCMNMPFEMLNAPVIGSQYWNVAFGRAEGECEGDTEGMQTMRTLARNMAWVVKNLNRPDAVPRTADEPWQPMHFIR